MKRFLLLSLALTSCTGRIDPPAPVIDKRDEMYGPKPVSKKVKQEQMISRIIDKYSLSTQKEVSVTPPKKEWAPAKIDDSFDQDLPQPLERENAPLETLKDKARKSSPIALEREEKEEEPSLTQPITPPTTPLPAKKLIWPVQGKVIKPYMPGTGEGANDGLNIEAKIGTPVLAVSAGKVLYSTNQGGFGNLVCIMHAEGLISVYAHLKEINVVKGDTVEQGETIGTVGKTGNVKRPQLHFELRKKGKNKVESFNPETLLNKG